MEAPEIIWLSPNEYRSNELSCFWSESQRTDCDIKYTRTDAFIEIAWDWIEDNLLSSNQQDKSRLYFKQFVNYMEGE